MIRLAAERKLLARMAADEQERIVERFTEQMAVQELDHAYQWALQSGPRKQGIRVFGVTGRPVIVPAPTDCGVGNRMKPDESEALNRFQESGRFDERSLPTFE